MRALLAALAFAAIVVPAPAVAAQAPGPPPVDGTWLLDFRPTSVRTVGDSVGRDAGLDCGVGSCGSSYQFSEGGTGGGQRLQPLVRFDAAGCAAPPCELRAVGTGGTGFRAPVAYDGTTYRATGKWFYASADACEQHLPDGTDTLTFTVDAGGAEPALSGTMTALLGYVGPTDRDGKCTDITGYEVYSGPVTGRPAAGNPGFAGGVTGPGAGPGAGSGDAARPRALTVDERAARDHTRPVLSTRLATARDLPWRPSSVLVSALLALLLVALMPFPAALFNNTLEANYAEVRGWFAFLRRPPSPDAPRPERRWRDFALMVGAVALLGAFLDPGLGLDRASAMLVAGLALSAAVVNLVAAAPARAYLRRRHGVAAHVALYPLGLALAAFCVLVSRLTGFEPGYLYGVVAGFAFAHELGRGERGRLSAGTAAFLLLVAGAAFALRIPVHDAVLDGGGWPLALLDTVLAALFAAGVEANVIGLLPIRFMPGEALFGWSRAAWAAAFGLSVFTFLHALSAAAGGASTTASVAVAATLFAAFGTVSVAFWGWFRLRRGTPAPVEG